MPGQAWVRIMWTDESAPVREKLITLVLTSAIFAQGCAVRRYHDYVFSVTGLVTGDDGAPVQNAEIALEVSGPVFEAITPVKTARQFTGESGGFVFAYISHEWGVKYTVTVRKEGFEPQAFSGSAPPNRQYEIRLERAGSDATSNKTPKSR